MGTGRRALWAVVAAVVVLIGGVAWAARDGGNPAEPLRVTAPEETERAALESTTTTVSASTVTTTGPTSTSVRAEARVTSPRATATTEVPPAGPPRVTGAGLHVVSADGSQLRRLADMPCQNGVMKIQWRHDSNGIVASGAGGEGITEYVIDGSRRALTFPGHAWDRSQASDAFVYKWVDAGHARVSVARGDFGGQRVDLADVGPGYSLGDVVFSPDASLIAVFRLDDHYRIYSSTGQVVHDWRPTSPAPGWHPMWTSDGRHLITAGQGYWAIPVDGGAPRKLSAFSTNTQWSISPGTGSRFVGGATGDPYQQLAVLDADTGARTLLPTGGGMAAWQPGTELIAVEPFTNPRTRRASIATFDSGGNAVAELVVMDTVEVREGPHVFTMDRNAQMLRWSPDGQWLSFVAC